LVAFEQAFGDAGRIGNDTVCDIVAKAST